MGFQFIW